MKYTWVFFIGIPLLVIVTYVAIRNKKKVIEKFGVFGSSAIPYDQAIKAVFTEKELPRFRSDWESKSMDTKSREIDQWNGIDPKYQNEIIKGAKERKDAREKIETI